MADEHRRNEKLVTVEEYEHDFEAEMAKMALENEGIQVSLVGGDLLANMPTIEPVKILLQVFESDFIRAKGILESHPELRGTPEDTGEDEEA